MSNSQDAESPLRQEACWFLMHKPNSRGSTRQCRLLRAAGLLGVPAWPPWLMDPRRLLSLNSLLLCSLAFELSCGTGEAVGTCVPIFGQLGSRVLLPLTPEAQSKSLNKSIHVIVTAAETPQSEINRKIVSLDLPAEGPPRHLEAGYRFHPENLSLEILDGQRRDVGWYSMTLEETASVQSMCWQLMLYEQVSAPEVRVLNETQEDGNCSVTLACAVERGDHVTYSWSEDAGAGPRGVANGSHLLHVTLGPQHDDRVYICTASNAIGSSSGSIAPWSRCTELSPVPRPWGLPVGLLLGGIIGVIMILQVLVLLFRRRGSADHYQPATEAKSLTVYAQVQKSGSVQKTPDSLPAQDPCTTIYVAATEPTPEPTPEPAQEPSSITIYASVTLPES